jgi:BirA family biotin operon repressor/biotin-[acetyl-CoA-carboxylase] ligase
MATNIRNTILKTLTDGSFHSGEQLANTLGVSRAAVSNHVKALQQMGLEIFSVTGKGYKLAKPLTLLNEAEISQRVNGNVNVISVIDSTNQYVKDQRADLTSGAACLAEAQTAGRGRHGRKWHSPFGANLYLSMFWHFDGGYQALDGLSLVIGLAVSEVIEALFNVKPQLKWPNDIYFDSRKLGGVLIEVDGQFGGACQAVIGIGLNVTMPEQENIDQPWVDLSQIVGGQIDRNTLSANLITALRDKLVHFENDGFAPFIQNWQYRHVYQDKPVRLINGKHIQKGVCRGIDQRGGILIENEDGITAHYGGEISVRPE